VGLDLQLEYWDQVGPTKSFAHPVNVERLGSRLEPTSRILDFGCGYGRALGILRQHGYENLVGFDPAPSMIAGARARHPMIEFHVLSDFRSIPLPNASVDAALVLAVLTCIPNNDAQRAIINEITRVLRPGGLLYISDMWLQSDVRNVERYERDAAKYGIYGVFDLTEGVTVRHHDRKWIEALLEQYKGIALDEIAIQTMNGHAASGFQWFGTASKIEGAKKAVAVSI
jgi:SAM-dependent methyltransferase